MLTLDLYRKLEEYLPVELRCEWDNDGIMVLPSLDHMTARALLCVDVTADVLRKARECGCDCIISHHPFIFGKLKGVGYGSAEGVLAAEFIRENIAVLSFHTRLDAAQNGINDRLAEMLGLKNVDVFECNGERIGRIGELERHMPFDEFLMTAKEITGAKGVAYIKNTDTVKTVAVTGGSYDEGIEAAKTAGADVFVTGEAKYHAMLYADAIDASVITLGHYFSEECAVDCLEKLLCESDITVEKYIGHCPIKYTEAD